MRSACNVPTRNAPTLQRCNAATLQRSNAPGVSLATQRLAASPTRKVDRALAYRSFPGERMRLACGRASAPSRSRGLRDWFGEGTELTAREGACAPHLPGCALRWRRANRTEGNSESTRSRPSEFGVIFCSKSFRPADLTERCSAVLSTAEAYSERRRSETAATRRERRLSEGSLESLFFRPRSRKLLLAKAFGVRSSLAKSVGIGFRLCLSPFTIHHSPPPLIPA